ncbi:MAG: hypothetical protein G01um101466_197 [Parcubacteria group bacterium Gr01-1014_66]|nr:MAG: hypothetical protein G01um101466_197 [Parcubacteria group bacterium Gr01-1014_66]
MEKPTKIKQGWQWKVFFYPRHVIKKRLTYAETRKAVIYWEKFEGKPVSTIDERTKQLIDEVDSALAILKDSGVPLKFFADIEFLPDGSIQQKRAVMLSVRFRNLIKKKKMREIHDIIDQFTALNFELWKYGIFERIFNVGRNNGIIGTHVVLLDPFELLSDVSEIETRLKEKPWEHWIAKIDFPSDKAAYFRKQCDGSFTIENFRKLWQSRVRS